MKKVRVKIKKWIGDIMKSEENKDMKINDPEILVTLNTLRDIANHVIKFIKNPDDIKFIRNCKTEDEFTGEMHHSLGRYIRNFLGLWDKDSHLYKWFKATYDLDHADDTSGLILKQIFLTLNGQGIVAVEDWINYDVQKYKKHWEKMNSGATEFQVDLNADGTISELKFPEKEINPCNKKPYWDGPLQIIEDNGKPELVPAFKDSSTQFIKEMHPLIKLARELAHKELTLFAAGSNVGKFTFNAPNKLSFTTLREANTLRLPLFKNSKGEPAHTKADGSDWKLSQWVNATSGELGELSEMILLAAMNKSLGKIGDTAKKLDRGDKDLDEARKGIAKEMADVGCYLDLLALRCGIDLGQAITDKFNEISERVNVPIKIKENGAYAWNTNEPEPTG